jgi:hypothetical protein
VAYRHGTASATDRAVNGGREVCTSGRRSPLSPHTTPRQHLSVYSGRLALGTIDVINGVFTAYDASGALVGRFQPLRKAADALGDGAAS